MSDFLSQGLGMFGLGTRPGGGGLWEGLKEGIGDVFMNSPVGLVTGAKSIMGGLFDDELSLPEKLAIGAGLAVGGGMTARRFHRMRMLAAEPAIKAPAMVMRPSDVAPETGRAHLERIGVRARRDRPEWGEAPNVVHRSYPGMRQASATTMSAPSFAETVEGLGSWRYDDPTVATKTAASTAILETYAQRLRTADPDLNDPQALRGVQFDFAKIEASFSLKKPGRGQPGLWGDQPNSKQFLKLWRQFTSDPESMSNEDVAHFLDFAEEFGSATSWVNDPDLVVHPTMRITNLDFTDSGLVPTISAPVWNAEGVFGSAGEATRHTRLRQLNYRALYQPGVENIRMLVQRGLDDTYARENNMGALLSKPLELGKDWYPHARAYIERSLDDLPEADRPTLAQAVAVVSTTSAAQAWQTNVDKAFELIKAVRAQAAFKTDEFHRWLFEGVNEAGGEFRFNAGEQEFDRLFGKLVGDGWMIQKSDLARSMRVLLGDPDEVFGAMGSPGGTSGMKQRHFYTNILYPEMTEPVTIDRHAYDAFLGLDTGIQNRPVDMVVDDENVYELIAEAYRQVAKEQGMLPHQVQAIAWETWKTMKAEKPRGWAGGDPYRLQAGDGSENLAFLAIQGLAPGGSMGEALAKVSPDRAPVVMSMAPVQQSVNIFTDPNGVVGVAGKVNPETVSSIRHLYPVMADPDTGLARWDLGRPVRVQSLEAALENSTGPVAVYDNAVIGVHPAMIPGEHVVVDVDNADAMLSWLRSRGYGQYRDLGPAVVDGPELGRGRRLTQPVDDFKDPSKSILTKGTFAALSANVSDDQVARYKLQWDNATAHRKLGAELRRAGYHPIEQRGVYDGEEISWLVPGMSPEDALKFGSKNYQDSVLTNDGLIYTDKAWDPENAGKFVPSRGISFLDDDVDNYFSETVIDGVPVKWSSELDFDVLDDFDPSATGWNKRAQGTARRVLVTLRPENARRVNEIVDQLVEVKHARNPTVYTHQVDLPGYTRVREHLVTDGTRTAAVRSADPEATLPNGFHAYVRDADGLPAEGWRSQFHVEEQAGGYVVGNRWFMLTPEGEKVGVGPSLFDTKVGTRKARFWAFDPEVQMIAVGRTAEEVDELLPGAPVTGQGLNMQLADPSDLHAAYDALDMLRSSGVKTTGAKVTAGDTKIDVADPPELKVGRKHEPFRLYDGEAIPVTEVNYPHALIQDWDGTLGVPVTSGIAKIDPRTEVTLLDSLLELRDADPEIWSEVGEIRLFSAKEAGEWSDPDALAFSPYDGGSALGLSEQLLNPAIVADMQRGVDTGYSFPIEDMSHAGVIRAVVWHEHGHVAVKSLKRTSPKEHGALMRYLAKVMRSSDVASEVSGYATTNKDELLAEAWSDYKTNANPRPLSAEIGHRLEQALETGRRQRKAANW